MRPLGLSLYRVGTKLISPAVPYLLTRRVRAGKEDTKRLNERVAQNLKQRAAGPLVWLHGASVGETLMLSRIVHALAAARPEARFVVTSQTLASADVLARRLPSDVARQQMAPIDAPAIVRRFLDHWKPDLAIFAESEIWPNMLVETSQRKIPLALVNARMTRGSIENWLRLRETADDLLSRFNYIGAADDLTALGIEEITGNPVSRPGSLKLDAPAPSVDEAELRRLREQIGDRPVWLAASTHAGEEHLAFAAHAVLKTSFPNALLIVAPRHSNRAEEIAKLAQQGPAFAQRSRNEAIKPQTSIYLADTMGEMGIFFSLAGVALMGGALKPNVGGHNPIEPARLGAYVLSGPHAYNFKEAYDAVIQHQAGQILKDDHPRTLAAAVETALKAKRDRTALAEKNAAWLPKPDAALEATVADLLKLAPLSASASLSPAASYASA
jgi:3-deoxy-D-manno-octulosonic-acid transferase